jgi:hypothetical protein
MNGHRSDVYVIVIRALEKPWENRCWKLNKERNSVVHSCFLVLTRVLSAFRSAILLYLCACWTYRTLTHSGVFSQ